MADKRSFSAKMNARLARWETALVVVFLMDAFEDKVLFPDPHIPPWGKIAIKMAIIIGLIGVFLEFAERRIDRGLATVRSAGDRLIVPRFLIHAALIGAVFVGYCWLKLGRLPWEAVR
jgi:hypothetical protein